MGSTDDYTLGPDSTRRDGVPAGTVTQHSFGESRHYPDTETDYWVYVPSQYSKEEPACVMVFQDGEAYVDPDGLVRAPHVMDNLIHDGEMPVTIGIFINPSTKSETGDMRESQYVPINEVYASFLIDEIIPTVAADYELVDDATGRAICGMSDGGLVSFTVGWHRPDAFSKVVSHIGSYTRLGGGSEYPYKIRKTRGEPKAIRVFLQDGENDLDLYEGNWTLANLAMDSALRFARYDYRFELGTGGHTLKHGGAIFPDTLRWLWRDYPGVRPKPVDLGAVTGQWDLVCNVYGYVVESELTIESDGDKLTATLVDTVDGEIDIHTISFRGDMLTIEHATPATHFEWMSKETDADPGTMIVWARVNGDSMSGALSKSAASQYDFRVSATRRVAD